jgi:O-antigen/teichoic acid export membrane protein
VAWTVQALRGLAIFAFSLALAWPLARFYDEPQMVYYVPVACFTAVLGGFNSTSLFLLNKRLHIGAVTLIDLISQIVGTITMIAVAYMWPSVWALLVGSVLSASATLVASHLVMPSLPMRIEWHRGISRELFHFGKWIFLATVLTFIVGRADRLILGKVISKSELGVYSIAVLLNGAVCDALQRLSSKVLFPVYSQLAASGAQRLRRQMLRIRLFLTVGILPPYYVLTLWGAQIVALLYKEPYHDAGWMLQVLAAGSSFSIVNTTISPILLSVGNSFRHMLLLAYQSAVLLIAMFIGGYYFGIKGFVVAISLSHITTYPVLVLAVRKYGAWLPALDFAAFAVSAAVCAIAFFM